AAVGPAPNLWPTADADWGGAGDKQGTYYAMDRDTGEIVWETQLSEGGLLGGVIATAASDGERIFVASNRDAEGAAAVVALDGITGDVVWTVDVAGSVFAPVSLIPGVVFVATVANEFHALDATDGSALWSMDIPDQGGSGASVVDGVVYWGYGYALFGTGSGVGGLYALAPGGEAPLAGSSGQQVEGELAAGAEVYRARCASCHGVSGQGAVGPELVDIDDRLSLEEQLAVVRNGSGGQMPRFEGVLSAQEIDEVVAFTRSGLGN
ncbi:MAG: PQQ-binding-like beta-propeller repeat protein, partial [Acidimicrobiia bacterium]|nr:PQQ-binding-like beta-propeller repeat protein [Acidimicrobiia bacterium]